MEPEQNNADRPAEHAEAEKKIQDRIVTIGLSVLALLFFGTLAMPSTSVAPLVIEDRSQLASAIVSEGPEITGRAAVVYDVQSGRFLYEKNPDAQLPLASVTKVMLVLAAGRILSGDAIVTITSQALRPEGDSGLYLGEQWKVRDLIDATLVPSSNDGAHALALAAGDGNVAKVVSDMNKIAHALGLSNTYFLNPTGLDESATMAGAYGSARDMARLFAHVVERYPALLEGTARDGQLLTSESGITHTAVNTNELLGEIPGLIGGKTGYTDLAGGNLVIAFDAGLGRPVIVAVLGSTQEQRFSDVRTLVQFSREQLK